MAYVNGASGHSASPLTALAAAPSTADNNQTVQIPPERLQQIREQLSGPFIVDDIKWRVTATSTLQTKRGPQKRGQLVAYADQRAYTDRLNKVFGEWGWTRSYDVQVAQNFERRTHGGQRETAVSAKVVVVSKVTIYGLGSHTGIGEEWADDENAATRAEAQAFKRACACFGLGRYLYDLDKAWVDLDQHNRPAHTPNLPGWALTANEQHAAHRPAASNQRGVPRQSLVRDELLAKVAELWEKAGRSLSVFVMKKYAGCLELERIGHAKLTTVFERLTDIGNGIDRLLRASTAIGDVRYAAICRELNLAGESINDIPDRDALKLLLARVEVEAGRNGDGTRGGENADIGVARGQLLQAARKLADRTGKRLADVITEASDGKLTLDGLKNLTDADVPVVSAATLRME